MTTLPPKLTRKTKDALAAVVGGFSKTSKMPCRSWSIPATECITGSKLRKVAGSTCSHCYALKGAYVWPAAANAMARRFATIGHPDWVEAFSAALLAEGETYFRWFDSGDLQSDAMLWAICEVAENTPNVTHWLPTREYKIVERVAKLRGGFPANLTVRVSAHMIDGPAPKVAGCVTSTVVSDAGAANCPAPKQGGKCQDCRLCWDRSHANTAYWQH